MDARFRSMDVVVEREQGSNARMIMKTVMDSARGLSLKHVGAQYNTGDRRNPEECVFARTEDENNGISCIPNKYRVQLTKGHI